MSELAWIIFLFVIPLAVLWTALVVDLVRRSDISVGKKVLWAGFTAFTAEFGAVVYILMRPLQFPEERLTPTAGNELAHHVLSAAERGDRTALDSARRDALSALEGSGPIQRSG